MHEKNLQNKKAPRAREGAQAKMDYLYFTLQPYG